MLFRSAYRLEWRAVTKNLEAPSGFAWHISPVPNPADLDISSEDLVKSSAMTWEFRAPLSALCLLTLEYRRPVGTIRATGSLVLQNVMLTEE